MSPRPSSVLAALILSVLQGAGVGVAATVPWKDGAWLGGVAALVGAIGTLIITLRAKRGGGDQWHDAYLREQRRADRAEASRERAQRRVERLQAALDACREG